MSVRWSEVCILLFLLPLNCLSQASVRLQPSTWKPVEFNEVEPGFGATMVGTVSEQKIISITNVSRSPVLLLQIQVTDNFQENDQCPMWLAEGRTCVIYITFSPATTGINSGRLYVDGAKANARGVWSESAFSQSIRVNGFGLPKDAVQRRAPFTTQSTIARTSNDEEMAYAFQHTTKAYTFGDLLKGNSQAIADDKKLFTLTRETEMRLRIASILLSLGVKDEAYFKYLENEADTELEHDQDIPWPFLYIAHEKSLNPAFAEWCKSRHLAVSDVERALEYPKPDTWYYLAAAGDSRFYDLLVRGLHSHNPVIVTNAAWGLAKLGDRRAVAELITAGQKAPEEALPGIIQSLIYFPDLKAQGAAEELTPSQSKGMLDSFRSEMKQKGIRALFQW